MRDQDHARRRSCASSPSSHSIVSMSRWFVGSSSSSRSGWEASARASEARVSSPPENVASGRSRSASREAEAAHDGGGAVAPVVAARVLEPALGAARSAPACARSCVAAGHRLLERAQLALERRRGRPSRRARTRAAAGRSRAGGRWSCSATRAPFSQASSPPSSETSPASARRSVVLPGAVRPGEREPVAALDLERDAVEERRARRAPCGDWMRSGVPRVRYSSRPRPCAGMIRSVRRRSSRLPKESR